LRYDDDALDDAGVMRTGFDISSIFAKMEEMAVLNIKNDETARLAHELAAEMGTSLTAAVADALRTRLVDVRQRKDRSRALVEIEAIARTRAVLDPRDHAAIIGYDAHGLPT
jgi:antitoxin VapB